MVLVLKLVWHKCEKSTCLHLVTFRESTTPYDWIPRDYLLHYSPPYGDFIRKIAFLTHLNPAGLCPTFRDCFVSIVEALYKTKSLELEK